MINWDDVIEDADATPRSALAQWLGRADEIEQVVIALKFIDADQVHYTAITQSDLMTVAILESAKQLCFKKLEIVD